MKKMGKYESNDCNKEYSRNKSKTSQLMRREINEKTQISQGTNKTPNFNWKRKNLIQRKIASIWRTKCSKTTEKMFNFIRKLKSKFWKIIFHFFQIFKKTLNNQSIMVGSFRVCSYEGSYWELPIHCWG